MAFFQENPESQHYKNKPFWILMKQKMMEWQWHQLDEWMICKLFAPRSRQITMPVPHHND